MARTLANSAEPARSVALVALVRVRVQVLQVVARSQERVGLAGRFISPDSKFEEWSGASSNDTEATEDRISSSMWECGSSLVRVVDTRVVGL